MKKISFLLIPCLIILFMNSCGPYYGTANMEFAGSTNRMLSKPVYNDSTETSNYVSGQYYNLPGYHENEISKFADILFHRSTIQNRFGYAYGGLIYFGNYTIEEIAQYQGKRSFYGTGITGEIYLNIPKENIQWRPIGLKMTFFLEGGQYSNFKKQAIEEDLIEYDEGISGIRSIYYFNNIFSIHGLTHDVFFNTHKLGIGIYSYLPVLYAVRFIRGTADFVPLQNAIYFTINKFTATISWTRFSADENQGIVSFGISCKIP